MFEAILLMIQFYSCAAAILIGAMLMLALTLYWKLFWATR